MGRQRPGRVVSALAEARCPPGQYRRGETREQVFRKRLESNSRGLPPKPLVATGLLHPLGDGPLQTPAQLPALHYETALAAA